MQIFQTAFYASSNPAQGQVSETINCNGLTALFVELVVNASAATLVGTVNLGMGVSEFSSYPNVQAATLIAPPATPTGVAVTAGAIVLTNPAIGRTVSMYRISNVGRLFKPTLLAPFAGGGDYDVRLTVWGFGQGTTP